MLLWLVGCAGSRAPAPAEGVAERPAGLDPTTGSGPAPRTVVCPFDLDPADAMPGCPVRHPIDNWGGICLAPPCPRPCATLGEEGRIGSSDRTLFTDQRHEYDEVGRIVTSTDAADGIRRRWIYEGDRPVQELQTHGRVSYAYDDAGRLARRTWEGTIELDLAYHYDEAGRLVRVDTPTFEVLDTFRYDAEGRIEEHVSSREVFRYSYGPQGLARVTRADGGSETVFTHDERGRVIEVVTTERGELEGRDRFVYDGDRLVLLEEIRPMHGFERRTTWRYECGPP